MIVLRSACLRSGSTALGKAATVARESARAEALARQAAQAKPGSQVLGTIQLLQQAGKAQPIRTTRDPSPGKVA